MALLGLLPYAVTELNGLFGSFAPAGLFTSLSHKGIVLVGPVVGFLCRTNVICLFSVDYTLLLLGAKTNTRKLSEE